MSSGIGYFWWLYALKHESPTRVTVFLALNPVTAALLGWALLGEAAAPRRAAALALVAAGPVAGHATGAARDNRRHEFLARRAAPSAHESRPRPESLTDLFFSFTLLALQGFGGVLAVVQRELVEKKRWMTREEFVEEWAVAQIMPGPNVVNLSLMIGGRYFGLRGAHGGAGRHAGRAAAGGAGAGAGLRPVRGQPAGGGRAARHGRGGGRPDHGHRPEAGAARCKKHPLGVPVCVALGVAAFVGIALLRWPLAWVLLGLGGAGLRA